MNDHAAKIAALDAEWEAERAQMLVNGAAPTHAPVRGIVGTVGSVIFTALLAASGLPAWVGMLGLIPFAWFLYSMLTGAARVERYEKARVVYESQRAALQRTVEQS